MSAVNKPLHKDLSFWIVAVTLVGAATGSQLYFGIPWFSEKYAQSRPAPRLSQNLRAGGATSDQTPPNLDTKKKTYAWQTPQFDPRALDDTPPQVVLIPTEYAFPTTGWGQSGEGKTIGIFIPAKFVVQSAYNWPSRSRMVLADPVPPGQFDFIANLPVGALEALQAEVKKQWGLVAQPETVQTNVWILQVDHANAPGLHPGTVSETTVTGQDGSHKFSNVPISFLANYLENVLRLPVLNRTGLTGKYSLQIPQMSPGTPNSAARMEPIRTALLEQLGLNLVATNAAVDMLVVKKARQAP